MKSLSIVLALVSFVPVAQAQKSFILRHQPKLGFISVSGGTSLPTGDFGCRRAPDQASGLAESGRVLNLAAGYRVVGAVGLMGRYQQQINRMDASALLALPQSQPAGARVATAGQWTVTTALFGPYISLLTGRFSVDLRALAGPATAVCPANTIEGWLTDDTPMLIKTSQGKAGSTAYSGGVTLSYRLGRSLAAQVSSDYLSTTVNFTDMTTTIQEGNRTQTALVGGQKTISVLNVSTGLTFLFGNRYRPF
ncbi:MAG: hypothetical protein H7Z72_20885 [Bacteroidetes bacterium]|nr:hypothetical protein [Fibrella sp.]